MCDHPDCGLHAEHRAPKSRERLNDYWWFCLDHVREYNRAWNYYAGMSDDEVEMDIRNSTCWDRPTWPLGMRMSGRRKWDRAFKESFGNFDDEDEDGKQEDAHYRSRTWAPSNDSAEARAYRTLALDPPVSLTALKARYKELVKRLHPDINGGDKWAEDRLKEVNEAYTFLKKLVTA